MGTTTVAHVKVKAARCPHKPEDVFIVIGSNADHNQIYADNEETVPGSVTFFACDSCTLNFDSTNVFPKRTNELHQGSNTLKPKGKGKTTYAINQPAPELSARIGPIIVVP
jgi:hypothetical protein